MAPKLRRVAAGGRGGGALLLPRRRAVCWRWPQHCCACARAPDPLLAASPPSPRVPQPGRWGSRWMLAPCGNLAAGRAGASACLARHHTALEAAAAPTSGRPHSGRRHGTQQTSPTLLAPVRVLLLDAGARTRRAVKFFFCFCRPVRVVVCLETSWPAAGNSCATASPANAPSRGSTAPTCDCEGCDVWPWQMVPTPLSRVPSKPRLR